MQLTAGKARTDRCSVPGKEEISGKLTHSKQTVSRQVKSEVSVGGDNENVVKTGKNIFKDRKCRKAGYEAEKQVMKQESNKPSSFFRQRPVY